ncbi:MAG: hypothetical protein HAW65_04855 [Alphaproteobacteria bacterium]|nr:hypothetical protein [Alphaproteobacteria bacterium]
MNNIKTKPKSALVLLMAVFILAGCATAGKFKETMEGWSGRTESFLVSQWGAPSSFYETEGINGNTIKHLTYKLGGQSVSQHWGYGIYTHSQISCTVTFGIVDARIKNVSWNGNGCVAK